MIDVVFLPDQLDKGALPESQIVVFDVLRATSTIVTALANRAREVRLFGQPEDALRARPAVAAPALLVGERGCVKMPGFDCGNSPGEYPVEVVGNASLLLSTTNGTRAAVAAAGAKRLLIASLLNATATANALLPEIDSLPTTLLCAGTDGRPSCEDMIGAGAILWALMQGTFRIDLPFTDSAWLAYHTFCATRARLPAALRLGQGGINLIEAGLEDDIDRCAALDSRPIVVEVLRDPLRAVQVH